MKSKNRGGDRTGVRDAELDAMLLVKHSDELGADGDQTTIRKLQKGKRRTNSNR